ncbi:DUF5361 domain-containing protein [Nocardia sp. NPDC058519]|uniref:DUF5361 domain-containing protein n=1 Tax=Nocardia sp. NPDC058519 TaxID=3346535 RepID=UPI003667B248
MGRAFGDLAGGILGLDALIQQHGGAIESDLIDRGLRLRQLGTDDLTWGDLCAIVTHRLPSSALSRALKPADWAWQLPELLMADIADSLRWLRWAKSTSARSGRPPKPIPRPGVDSGVEKIGTQPIPIADMAKFLGWEEAA